MGGFIEYETVERCTLCGGPHHRQVPGRRHIRRCTVCGHLFVSPRPTQRAVAASYDSGEGTHAVWAREREGREVMWAKRARRVANLINGGRALDVGTGFGDFPRHLRQTGPWQVEGTEVSQEARHHAETVHGIVVHEGQVEECGLSEESYDLITFWHVLEHVPQPGDALELSSRLLRRGGMLAIAVPNEGLWPRLTLLAVKDIAKRPIAALLGRPYRRSIDAFFGEPAPGREIHLSYFHPKRLSHAVEQHGFEVVAKDVDDLYAIPTARTDRAYRLYTAVNRLTGTNFGPAAFVAARKL